MYAVAGQIFISASNYVVFVLLAISLSGEDFIAFSTAVGLNMLAFAVAEGGVSYVAPRELASDRANASSLAGAFVLIGMALYAVAMIVGFFIWDIFSKDGLDAFWAFAYAIYFIPSLLIPVWVTCWSINIYGVFALGLARIGMISALYFAPSAATLICVGLVFFIFVLVFIVRLNSRVLVISWANISMLRVAVLNLQEVFLTKTMSYALYALAPLVIGVIHGNALASVYVIGERMKSLYATVFQPLTQTMYLWQVQSSMPKFYTRISFWGLNTLNVLACISLIVATDMGLLELLGERFVEVNNINIYIIAAFFSVATSLLLYFLVFPVGNYRCFRRATIMQMLTFIILYIAMSVYPWVSPAYILCIAEAIIFVAVVTDLIIDRKKTSLCL